MSYTINEALIPFRKYTRPGKKIAVKGVVIHWTANERKGAGTRNHFTYFSNSTSYASAHYFVDTNEILRLIPDNEMAYHVGSKTYKTKKYGAYPNDCMIGVEMCVNIDGNFNETYKKSVWLVAHLLKKHKLTINELERHYDITGKDCPKMFVTDATGQKYLQMSAVAAWQKFQTDVKAAMVTPAPKPVAPPVSKPDTTPAKEGVRMFNPSTKTFKDETEGLFKAAKEAGIFSSSAHAEKIAKGEMPLDDVIGAMATIIRRVHFDKK